MIQRGFFQSSLMFKDTLRKSFCIKEESNENWLDGHLILKKSICLIQKNYLNQF